MAITKIHAIKSTLGKALAYIENPDKTDGQMLVSGYNCEPQTASIDFEVTAVLSHKARNLKRKRSTNLAYHLIQSFSPEDAVTPEQAHELGKKLAFEYTGGKYEYVVATHIDKGHIHNHIMINAVSFYDYKKLRTVPYRTARQIRDISDRLCMEAHLSVIDDPQKIGQLYPENAGKKKSVSNRTEIRKRLNFCLERATDYSQFLSMAKELEITPTIRGKHISYLLEGAGRAVRDNSLSDTDTFTYVALDIKDTQAEIEQLEQLVNQQGVISSPFSGVISNVEAEVGTESTQTFCTIYDTSKGYLFACELPAAQASDCQTGLSAVIKQGDQTETAAITAISENAENDTVDITIQLTATDWKVGPADAEIVLSEQDYDLCLPNTAIHQDNQGDFVFAVEEKNTVLGTQNVLVRIPVTVLEVGQSQTSIEGAILPEDSIVVQSTRSLEAGSKVRVKNENA